MKVVARPTRDAVAVAMLHEPMNGYSIVFSGVILHASLPKIFPANAQAGGWKFVKVDSVVSLGNAALERDNRGQASTIGILC